MLQALQRDVCVRLLYAHPESAAYKILVNTMAGAVSLLLQLQSLCCECRQGSCANEGLQGHRVAIMQLGQTRPVKATSQVAAPQSLQVAQLCPGELAQQCMPGMLFPG